MASTTKTDDVVLAVLPLAVAQTVACAGMDICRTAHAGGLTWESIDVHPAPNPVDRSTSAPRMLLQNVSGHCRSGRLMAVMGASGAGKTTLLNCLSGRTSPSRGTVRFSERSVVTAFVEQTDVFHKTLTVLEHLLFQAKLRLPESTSHDVLSARVATVVGMLGLSLIVHHTIGDVGMGGISGGERRRVSIASELLTSPRVLFLDEPTSGLDSTMAESVVQTLHNLTRVENGPIVVCTIHQPSSYVFSLFDDLCLLANGQVAYCGPTADVLFHFTRLNMDCPAFINPAEFIVKQLSQSVSRDLLLDAWRKHAAIVPPIVCDAKASETVSGALPKTSLLIHWSTLLHRAWLTTKRDPVTSRARLIQAVVLGVLIGILYLQIGDDQKSVQSKAGALYLILMNQIMAGMNGVLQSFVAEIAIFRREQQGRLYSPLAFFLAKTLSDLPFQMVFPLICVSLSYWLIGFQTDPVRFLTTLLAVMLTSNCAYSFGYVIAIGAPSVPTALAIAPVAILPLLVFGGFLINVASIPVYFYWLAYVSFLRYGFEIAMISEFHGRTLDCSDVTGGVCSFPTGQAVLDRFSFDADSLSLYFGILVVLLVAFRLIAFWLLHRKARQMMLHLPIRSH